jgi:hypothetical protein
MIHRQNAGVEDAVQSERRVIGACRPGARAHHGQRKKRFLHFSSRVLVRRGFFFVHALDRNRVAGSGRR